MGELDFVNVLKQNKTKPLSMNVPLVYQVEQQHRLLVFEPLMGLELFSPHLLCWNHQLQIKVYIYSAKTVNHNSLRFG